MATIRIPCVCGKTIEVPASWAGKAGKCKACGRLHHVPAPTPTVSSTPKPQIEPQAQEPEQGQHQTLPVYVPSSSPESIEHIPPSPAPEAIGSSEIVGHSAKAAKGSALSCPHCGSENCSKVSFVYESGTFAGSVVGVGMSLGGDIGFGGGQTQNRSLLAKRLAPPVEPNGWLALAVILVSCTALAFLGLCGLLPDILAGKEHLGEHVGLSFGALILAVFSLLAFVHYRRKIKVWRSHWECWPRCWVCLRCGYEWIPY